MKNNPTYTLEPKMVDGHLEVYIPELQITVKTKRTMPSLIIWMEKEQNERSARPKPGAL